MHDIDRLLVSRTDVDEEALLGLLRVARQLHLKLSILPHFMDVLGPGVEVDDVEGVTVLGLNPPLLSRSSRFLKRSLDVGVSAGMLVTALPLMALVALAIRIDSKGPAFFRQRRIGKGAQCFNLLKFRTMVCDAERLTAELLSESRDPNWLKLENDPRVTRVGRFLRKSSLDELPQLWNVLKGEMSLVGPRPLIESEDRLIGGWARSRLDLTPGMTGWWQVLGRSNIPFDEMVKLDYLYVTGWSLWTDVRLMVRTLPAVLKRRGAN
jgi:exopolysaccharide biosynthesis polyprenyl glycosylphosphotransferase